MQVYSVFKDINSRYYTFYNLNGGIIMQNENSTLKKAFSQPAMKWIVVASVGAILLLSTLIVIGLKSQYIELKFCVATKNCIQESKRVAENATNPIIIEDKQFDPTIPDYDMEKTTSSHEPFKIVVKPSSISVISGVASTGVVVALTAFGIVAIPIELALVIGAFIASGTYVALKTLY
jgi:hypothetical protein